MLVIRYVAPQPSRGALPSYRLRPGVSARGDFGCSLFVADRQSSRHFVSFVVQRQLPVGSLLGLGAERD